MMILRSASRLPSVGQNLLKSITSASRQVSSSDAEESGPAVSAPPTRNVDRSRVPQLNESDLEEHFVSGSGPGGQCVNKSINCCQLKHKPTGLTVKVHHTRSLESNRKIARELMIAKLDKLFNGENSVECQKKRYGLYKISVRKAEQERRRLWKEEWRSSMNNSASEKEKEGRT